MATEFIVTLKASGGDFTSLATWESSMQAVYTAATTKVFSHGGITGSFANNDIVTGDSSGATGSVIGVVTDTQILLDGISGTFTSGEKLENGADNVTISDAGDSVVSVLECDGFDYTGAALDQWAGWGTDATNHAVLRAIPGQEHDGVTRADGGSGFRLSKSSGGQTLDLNAGFITIQDIETLLTVSTSNSVLVRSGCVLTMERCIIQDDAGTSAFRVLGGVVTMNSTLIINTGASGNGRALDAANGGTSAITAKQSTFIGKGTVEGADCGNDADNSFTNCIAITPTGSSAWKDITNVLGDFNGSNDTSSPGSTTIDNISLDTGIDFTDHSTDDYTPVDGGALDGAGTNSVQIDDIANVAHNDPPEIGCYALITAGTTIAVGLASETDTAFDINPIKDININVGLALETDTAFDIIPVTDIVISVGLASEIDSAFDITPVKDILVNIAQALETDTAFSIAPVKDINVNLGLASEVDSAFSITPVKDINILIGLASEIDTAFSISPTADLIVSVGLASEVDTAFTFTVISVVDIGQALEIDTAFPVVDASPQIIVLGLALELDTAFNILTGADTADLITGALSVIEGAEFPAISTIVELPSSLISFISGDDNAINSLIEQNAEAKSIIAESVTFLESIIE